MLALAIYGNLIPFHFQAHPLPEAFTLFLQTPFLDASDLGARGDWVVSVALFAALSFLLMAAVGVDRPPWVSEAGAIVVFSFCAALSVLIEFTQIFFPPRTVSLNDIAVETLGGLAGTLVWVFGGQRLTRHIRKLVGEPNISGLASRLLPCYFVLLLIVELMPFDLIVSTQELAGKYEEGRIWLLPFRYGLEQGPLAWLAKALTNMVCFFPAGFLGALARGRRTSEQLPWRGALLFGLGITSSVLFLKLFVYTRFCDTTDIVTGTAAVVAGSAAGQAFQQSWRRWSNRTKAGSQLASWRPLLPLLFVVWFAAVAYFNWRPFDFTTNPARFADDLEDLPQHGLRRFSWLPVVDYYWSPKYEVLDQFFKKTFAFVLFGFLTSLALHPHYRPGSAWPAVLAALALGGLFQIGRYYLPGRGPSVTDVGLGCIGAWLGFTLSQHLRAILWAERALFVYPRS